MATTIIGFHYVHYVVAWWSLMAGSTALNGLALIYIATTISSCWLLLATLLSSFHSQLFPAVELQ